MQHTTILYALNQVVRIIFIFSQIIQ